MFYYITKYLSPYCVLILSRFPIAIKTPKCFDETDIKLFLDEIKSMLEIGSYHDHIINLQGVSYELDEYERKLTEVIAPFCYLYLNKYNFLI